MLVFPNAKINIGLNIINKRKDGFHNLETIFYPIDLSDILEFVESKSKERFNTTGIDIEIDDEHNLVLKAYHLLKKDFNLPELEIHLHKSIPTGAGLGGGSSDASFMLKTLNDHFELNINSNQLETYAQELGSDCPFFIKNKPVFAEGTGNIFSEIDLDLSKYYIAIIKPDIQIPTKLAFSNIKAEKPLKSLKELIKLPMLRWKDYIKNDFEENIFKEFPKIKDIKDRMYNAGALYAQMSGSGSSVFGIFKEEPKITSEKDSIYYTQKPRF